MNNKNNLTTIIFSSIIILLFTYLIISKILVTTFSNKKKINIKPIITRNFIDINKPIYSNNEYKKTITQEYVQPPIPDDGARVNYFNSDLGYPLYPEN